MPSNFTALQPEQCRKMICMKMCLCWHWRGLRQCVIAVWVWRWKLSIWSAHCQCERTSQFSYVWREQESSWCLFHWQISVWRTCTYKTNFFSLLFLFYKAYVNISDCLPSPTNFWMTSALAGYIKKQNNCYT